MKKPLNKRLFAVVCLVVLVYCLSILIEKRISSDTSFDFRLWSPFYLIFAILIPMAILIPLRFFPASKYSLFMIQKEKTLKKVTFLITGFLLLWLLGWYAMSSLGKLMDKSLKQSEANEAAITYIKTDSIVYNKIGSVDSIQQISYTIDSQAAKFDFIVHGSDSIVDVEILLNHEQIWIVDTLIIK